MSRDPGDRRCAAATRARPVAGRGGPVGRVRPRSGARLFLLENEGLLLSDALQSLFHLNTSAAYIWCLLEDGLSAAAVASRLGAAFGLDRLEARAQLADVLRRWRSLGLIGPTPLLRRGPRRVASAAPPVRPSRPRQVRAVLQANYCLLGSIVRVRYGAVSGYRAVHPVLEHLAVEDGAVAAAVIDVVDDGGGWDVLLDGGPLSRACGLDALAPLVKAALVHTSVNRCEYFASCHAGAVADGDGCILLPGRSGSGKSTLTAALVHAGYRYLSDEIALLQGDALEVGPAPLALCCKSTGWEVLAPLFPELDALEVHRREDGKRVRYLPPPLRQAAVDPQRRLPVRLVVFPHFRREGQTVIRAKSKAAALGALLEDAMALPRGLNSADVAAAVAWIKGVGCYDLEMSSLDDAVAAVRSLAPGAVH